MKRLIALFAALVVTVAGAQTVQTTPNLITSGTSHTWYGVTTGAVPAGCATAGPCPGGPTPIYDPATNMITFSYNANASVGQTLAINQALANVGAGVKINGYAYSYDVRNMNGDDRQPGIDTFTVSQLLRGPANSVLLSSSQYYNTKFEWKTVTGTKVATTPYNIADTSYIQFGVTGGDNGFWGGYFGPQIRNVEMKLNYTVDPCATNPAYSPTCANYNTVSTSGNLFTGTTGPQAYAINQALSIAGAGATIHGFDYGYNYSAAGRTCAFWDLWGACITGWNYSSAGVTTTLTNSAGVVGYTETNTHDGGNNGVSGSYNKSLRLSSSVPMATLGTFSMTPTTSGNASITNMYSNAVYTADPCLANPLSSTTCSGYQQAYHDQQCSVNPLYMSDCPGYAAAYQTQQCTANPLYSPSCPGYTQAYRTQQCSINPLFATDCPGYAQAYHDQQCSISALYATDCTGYQQAYHDQQCAASALYATDCTGYQAAYLSQQCSLNSLYSSQCPGYAVAYHNQQCSISALYASDCTGYAQAYHDQQCSANPLYMSDCPGYAVAYKAQQCGISALYATDCPGYAVAYKAQQCSLNALYATDCPGYQQAYFNQQCNLNGLYDRTCPNYSTAYAAQQALKQTSTVTPEPTITAGVLTAGTTSAITEPVPSPVAQATTTPTTTSATSVTSVTSVVNPAPATAGPTSVTTVASTSSSKEAPKETSKESSSSSTTSTSSTGTSNSRAANKPPEDRKSAEARAKVASESMKNATKMEDQVAVQGAVVNSMAFVPGFSAYQNALVPDVNQLRMARQYNKPPVDNDRTRRLLGGAQEHRWNEMVDSQYQLGK